MSIICFYAQLLFFMAVGERAESMKSWINAMFPFCVLAAVFYDTPEHLLYCLIIFSNGLHHYLHPIISLLFCKIMSLKLCFAR